MQSGRKALLALAWLAAAALAVPASAKPHTLTEAQGDFPNSKAVGHNLCLVIDGVRVAVFATEKDAIIGVLAYPNPPKDPKLAEKLIQALELEDTTVKFFGDKKRPAAFILCKGAVEGHARSHGGAFDKTLGDSLAFVAASGGFSPDKVTDDAFLWKMGGANIQIAFPITDGKIQVLEAMGPAARSMNSHKAEKLADKLGMGQGGKEIDRNTSKMIAQFIGCEDIFYSDRTMDKDFWKNVHENKQEKDDKNKKIHMSVVRTENKRILLGNEELLRNDDPGRDDFDTLWPTEESTWPGALAAVEQPKEAVREKKRPKPKKTQPVAVVEKDEEEPQKAAVEETERELTPSEAMDAYLQYLQEL